MIPSTLLIANRGEIAIRVIRAAAELGIRTVAVHSADDADSLHTRKADVVRPLEGRGVRAYLDSAQLLAAAAEVGADAIHPGYGFLSENASFAKACAAAGVRFVGPRPEVLELFGDKVAARRGAQEAGVPTLAGSAEPVSLAEARRFFGAQPGGIVLKAVAGGGGRGMRVVRRADELDDAYARCISEAAAAFGDGAVYAEALMAPARHVEIQVLGDGAGAVAHLGERDCSVQRRHQKLIEVAPSPGLPAALRERIIDAALALARAVRYDNIGTFEFLVDAGELSEGSAFAFIEANPRLQVEHTVTEEVTGVDLVETQLRLAGGASLAELGFVDGGGVEPKGCAIQVRINMETMDADGATVPTGGTIGVYELPSGKGIRVDGFGYAGYRTSPSFDSLLAKLIVHRPSGGFAETAAKAYQALRECRIEGVETNLGLLADLVSLPDFAAGRITTGFIEEHLGELGRSEHERRFHAPPADGAATPAGGAPGPRAGARIDQSDPLAVLAYGKTASPASSPAAAEAAGPDGTVPVAAPMQGTVVSLAVEVGDPVRPGQLVAVMESMKMEHEIRSEVGGHVRRLVVAPGDTVFADTALLFLEEADVGAAAGEADAEVDLDRIRPDLAEIAARRAVTLDANRPDAVARRHAAGGRTARENVEDLCDPGTFVEYGPLVVAAQKRRRTMEELLVKSPADGMVTGVGSVNGELFGDPTARCAVMAYDYTVFAGTQGIKNHQKTDRLIQVAREGRMPMVLFAEGGGGRPGDTDGGDHGTWTFNHFAKLSGLVPIIGITAGRCYAGNASLLGCCDVIIAAQGSNIGMGGPAMIEGGGLGVFAPEEIGPMSVQTRNGVVDVAVADEAEAVRVAKQYLAYFQGSLPSWEARDQREMRPIIPENRLRVYEVRRVIDTLADVGTVLELRKDFGVGIVTSLIRVEGRPVGVIANNPKHLGGAIDSDGADKGARFMQLCDAFDIPILFLVDTPGIMVGPEIEKTALVRHSSRMFVVGANLSVPVFTIILRKAYGLGCIAVSAGSFKAPLATVAWPTGEFGGMGLEGSVKLGFRDVLANIDDPDERVAVYEKLVAKAYEVGKALRYATGFAIDDTIDPAESRFWLANLLSGLRPPPPRAEKKRPFIDAW